MHEFAIVREGLENFDRFLRDQIIQQVAHRIRFDEHLRYQGRTAEAEIRVFDSIIARPKIVSLIADEIGDRKITEEIVREALIRNNWREILGIVEALRTCEANQVPETSSNVVELRQQLQLRVEAGMKGEVIRIFLGGDRKYRAMLIGSPDNTPKMMKAVEGIAAKVWGQYEDIIARYWQGSETFDSAEKRRVTALGDRASLHAYLCPG